MSRPDFAAPHQQQLIDQQAGIATNAALALLGCAVLTGAVILAGVSYLPGEPLPGSLQFIPFLVAAFAVAFWAMIVLRFLSDPRTRRGGNFRLPPGRKAFGELPARTGRLVAALIIIGLAQASALVWAIRIGQPYYDQASGGYLVHKGAASVPVSAATYHHVLVLENRGFLGAAFAVASFFLPVLLNLALRQRRGLPSWVEGSR